MIFRIKKLFGLINKYTTKQNRDGFTNHRDILLAAELKTHADKIYYALDTHSVTKNEFIDLIEATYIILLLSERFENELNRNKELELKNKLEARIIELKFELDKNQKELRNINIQS